jgi:hypothetical protein
MFFPGALQLVQDLRNQKAIVAIADRVSTDPRFIRSTLGLENWPLGQSLRLVAAFLKMLTAMEEHDADNWIEAAAEILALFNRFPLIIMVEPLVSKHGPS